MLSVCIYLFIVNQIVKFWFQKYNFKTCKELYWCVTLQYLTQNGFHLFAFGDLGFYTLISSLYFLNEISFYGPMKYKQTPKTLWAFQWKPLLEAGFKPKRRAAVLPVFYLFIGLGRSRIWSCTKPAGSLAVFQSAFQSNCHLSLSSRNVTVMMMCEMETRQLAFQTRQAGTGTTLPEFQGSKSDVEPIQCK